MPETVLILIRAVVAGLLVVAFAMIGNVVQPKRFAGLFGAAPSIALANLLVVIASEGDPSAAQELRAMVCGSVGFVGYCAAERFLLPRHGAIVASVLSTGVWAVVAVAGYFWLLQ